MKIIHCADLHLGSRLTSLPAGEIRDARKNDILASFDGLINYANDNGVQIIMFSGDVFDSDRPTKKDKAYFYNAIQSNPNIAFLYLKGNHDTEESLVENYDNLHTFSERWASYAFEGVIISGIELSSSNKTSLYSSLNLKKEDVNIVMMHGDINTKGKEYIDLSKLANKSIDYLALGHIHTYSQTKIDSRGIAVYSGCLDGRGFDELGEKGFVVIEANNKKISHQFIPFSSRLVIEKEIDLSGVKNLYEAQAAVKAHAASLPSNAMVKIVLSGKVDFDIETIESDIESFIKGKFFFVKVESKLKQIINAEKYQNDFSLKGEFVRLILSSEEYSQEEKDEIINTGIKLFNGEAIER